MGAKAVDRKVSGGTESLLPCLWSVRGVAFSTRPTPSSLPHCFREQRSVRREGAVESG